MAANPGPAPIPPGFNVAQIGQDMVDWITNPGAGGGGGPPWAQALAQAVAAQLAQAATAQAAAAQAAATAQAAAAQAAATAAATAVQAAQVSQLAFQSQVMGAIAALSTNLTYQVDLLSARHTNSHKGSQDFLVPVRNLAGQLPANFPLTFAGVLALDVITADGFMAFYGLLLPGGSLPAKLDMLNQHLGQR
ncbi:MAG: hypothetical protein WDW38_002333 [Sanguina aurantia]